MCSLKLLAYAALSYQCMRAHGPNVHFFFFFQVRACADACVWRHLRSTARSCFFFFLSGSSSFRLALSGCECVTQRGIRCVYFLVLLLLLLLLLPAEIALRTPANFLLEASSNIKI